MACVLPPNIEIQLDTMPTQLPYVPRICENRGYFFIWYGNSVDDSDLVPHWIKAINEPQWVRCSEEERLEKGVALIFPYEECVIIGAVKTAGYMNTRSKSSVRKFIKSMWADITTMFSNKTIICPAGSYFEQLHQTMNNKRIPHEAYHYRIMMTNGFVRQDNIWIREVKEK